MHFGQVAYGAEHFSKQLTKLIIVSKEDCKTIHKKTSNKRIEQYISEASNYANYCLKKCSQLSKNKETSNNKSSILFLNQSPVNSLSPERAVP